MSTRSALYAGSVAHRRLRPVPHHLRYRAFWLLLDLEELPGLAGGLRLFSLDRFNVFSLHFRDHGAGDRLACRDHVERMLRAAGMPGGGRIQLLCMPRVLGYVFNPLSLYLCLGADGALQAVVYEVNNTFGERHSYVLEVPPGSRPGERVAQDCAKCFHVSPFLDLDMRYRFDLEPPAQDRAGLRLTITAEDSKGPVLVATMQARRRPLTDRVLALAFAAFPLLTVKVIVAIHWEALLLWLKRVGVRPHPGTLADEFTIGKGRPR